MKTTGLSVHRKADLALEAMPQPEGRAACLWDFRFDALVDQGRLAVGPHNELARVCAGCTLTDCGSRLTRRLTDGERKFARSKQPS